MSPVLLFMTRYLNIFMLKYYYIGDTYIVTAINQISVSQLYSSDVNPLTLKENLHESVKLCTLACTVRNAVYFVLSLIIVYIVNVCLYYQCTFSCFKNGSQKTTKELLLEAERQVSNKWTITEQVGKFYLKDFLRLLKEKYKQEPDLFLAGSVGERFGNPT